VAAQASRTVYGLGAERAILANRLRLAAEPIAEDARRRSAEWSRRVPLSVRLQGGASRITIAAGGARAPQALTMEGYPSGRPRAHPVFAHGERRHGPPVPGPLRPGEKRRYDPPGWTWAPQIPVRPFLAQAVDAKQDEMVRIFAGIIDDWAKQLGYK
jgi:hypothetical protein